KATNYIDTLSRLPLSVRVDTSPYRRSPPIFDKIMFTWDEDAPFLFINDVQCTMAEANMEIETVKNITTNETYYTTYSYDMVMMIVDPDLEPDKVGSLDYWIHQNNAFYGTPAFRHINREDVIEAGSIENSKNITRGFSGGLGIGFGAIALSCLITALIVDDYQGTLLAAGLVSGGLGAAGVFACNKINDNLNVKLAEVYNRMAAAANGKY
ncbi:MAG: hypothetical protein JW760_15060, partial [Spirochaetales bacterium]|nr:hypothetical protein [Spirochaetales bacterium]